MGDALKPCPFCGKAPNDAGEWVECVNPNCGLFYDGDDGVSGARKLRWRAQAHPTFGFPLKPCPFCGSKAYQFSGLVTCSNSTGCPVAGLSGIDAAFDVRAWNTRHDDLALDFGVECTDGMSRAADVEHSRGARGLKALRRIVKALDYGCTLNEYVGFALKEARDLLREIEAPDDGVEGRRVKTLRIERGGGGL